jgi:hypothetical protein
LAILWEPNETLFCTSEVGDYSDPAYDPVYFLLLFPHDALDWHLVVRYPGDATRHSNRVSCHEFASYRLHIKASGYSLLQHTARLVLCVVSTVASEMRVPKLSGSPGTSRLVVWLFSLLYGCFIFRLKAGDESIYSAKERKVINTWTQEPRNPGKLIFPDNFKIKSITSCKGRANVVTPIQLTTLG